MDFLETDILKGLQRGCGQMILRFFLLRTLATKSMSKRVDAIQRKKSLRGRRFADFVTWNSGYP